MQHDGTRTARDTPMAVNPQHFTEINGVRVQFRVRGSGEPLLLLHGWGGSSLSFAATSARLEERFRVLSPELPGFGFSQSPPAAWGAGEYANVISGLLVASGFGAVNVVGHSFGGLVATALATSRPALVRRLVLVASPVVRLPADRALRSRIGGYARVKFLANLLLPFRDRILEWGRERYGSEDYRQAGNLRPTLVKVLGEDWRDALPTVQTPALLVYGENDEDVPLAIAHAAMEALPEGARLVVMPGAGHFPFLDDTDGFVDALTEFLLPAEAVADA
jgi:pimeloyl-ACP methyl ester carboxylesterase